MRPLFRTASILLILFAAGSCSRTVERPMTEERGPVIIVSVDTLRADRLPAYGYTSGSTPHLDAFVKEAVLFENAYSHVPLTLPSHASLLTGKLPPAHGVRNNLGYRFDASAHPTIPSLLAGAGYQTGAAVSAYVLRGDTGMAAAFQHYDDAMDGGEAASVGAIDRAGERTVAAAKQWITGRSSPQFFFLLHLFEPHTPYAPPEPFRSRFAGREYDGEIAAADALFGDLVAFLRERGLYDSATIIFLSDHGEGLGDHGESEHGIFLYREAIHVPLVMKLPAAERGGTRVAAPVQLIDVLPTVAQLTGVTAPPDLRGTSLLSVAAGESPDRRIYSESMYPKIHLGLSDLASLVDGRFHYIEAPRAELYDLAADPEEKENILADQRRVYAAMRDELGGVDRSLAAPSAVSGEEAAKLAALGYLSAPVSSGAAGDPKDHIGDLEDVGRAAAYIEGNRPELAIPILERLVKANPAFADAWSHLGRAYARSGHLTQSIAAWRRTIEIAPMLAADGAVSIAESYLALGRTKESIEHAQLAVSAHPAAARLVLAKAYLTAGQFAAAEGEAEKLIASGSKQLEGTIVQAQIRLARKQLPEAAIHVAEARRLSAEKGVVPMLSFVEGDLLARQGRIPEAKAAFLRETQEFPRNREAYVRLAVLQTLQGAPAEAERTFERMVRSTPDASSYAIASETFAGLGRADLAARWRNRK